MGRRDKGIPANEADAGPLPLGSRMRYARLQQQISLTALAERLGYTKSHLSTVENNKVNPSPALIEGYERELSLSPGELFNALNIQQLNKNTADFAITRVSTETRRSGKRAPVAPTQRPRKDVVGSQEKEDWGEAPRVTTFYGRAEELGYLNQAILNENCRLAAILGIGGVGKTTLTAHLARELRGKFEYVFWRSLQHTPSLTSVLERCILFLSDQRVIAIPQDETEQILLLLDILRRKRCLLILDNMEAVLQGGTSTGTYLNGYEGYGKLLSMLGEAEHQSCLLITSREKPREISPLEGRKAPVRSVRLPGLTESQGQEILETEGLYGSDDAWRRLVNLYSGNPLALKLVSEPIRELFAGSIEAFLQEEETLVGDVYFLLEQQFNRLSPQEQEIMYWLAIERETTSLETLLQDVLRPITKTGLLEILNSLRRRFMIEMLESLQFTMQPAIMEYVIDLFVDKIYQEIYQEVPRLFTSHTLLKAQAKDDVREAQARLIIEPVLQRLTSVLGRSGCEGRLYHLLTVLREQHTRTGYAAGNVLDILVRARSQLRYADFSQLPVWQAYLQGVTLHDVNFTGCDLSRCAFNETFGRILSVSLSASGKYLAAGTSSGEIRLWSIPDGTLLQTFLGHTDWVQAVAFSPDERSLVSGSDDQSVRYWDVNSGRCLAKLVNHTGRIYAVAFHPDGSLFASASEDQNICIWDIKNDFKPRVLSGHTGRVYAVSFSTDRRMLASCGDDQSVRIWDLQTGRARVFKGHTDRVWSVDFSADSRLLVSGGEDQRVLIWDIRTGRSLAELTEQNSAVYTVGFSPDGRRVATGGVDRNVHIWNTENWQHIRLLLGHSDTVCTLAFSSDSNLLISGGDDRCVRIWDIERGSCIRTLQGQTHWLYALAFSPDSKLLASGGDDGLIRLWDVATGRCVREMGELNKRVRALAFSPDGSTIACGSEDQTVSLWDVRGGRSHRVLAGHLGWVHAVAYSPDGSLIASCSDDQSVRIWDANNGQCLKVLQGHTDWVRTVAFSPDGRTLASGSEDQSVRLWNVASGTVNAVLRDHTNRVWSVAFSPDGKRIVSGSDDYCVRVWEVGHTNDCLLVLPGHEGRIWSVAYSPDGICVVSSSEDYTIRVWDTSSGECMHVLSGHTNRVCSIVYSPDGQWLASASHDGTILLWDKEGECAQLLRADRPYERMKIGHVTGLTEAQKSMLADLGAVDS
ncbi:MAG TPA: NB-ARC domain-containing protein [Ktedonobacteraceae bacterium]|nr:NB-ARC domain-containing protein [Ktedonobacteraceae bacterium]